MEFKVEIPNANGLTAEQLVKILRDIASDIKRQGTAFGTVNQQRLIVMHNPYNEIGTWSHTGREQSNFDHTEYVVGARWK